MVEDFFDIIYAMHVEMGADPGRAPKHAGQKKTYKAVSQSTRWWVVVVVVQCFLSTATSWSGVVFTASWPTRGYKTRR